MHVVYMYLINLICFIYVKYWNVVDLDFCDTKCGERCSKSSVQDRCLKYCGICCEKCNCVPSGTYGNKDECPCYRDMKNSKGQGKCP